MSTYSKPAKTIMAEWAAAHLKPGQLFNKQEVVSWFKERYPLLKHNTVEMHVEGMAVNNANIRRNHKTIKPGSKHDLFFKVESNLFRLWDKDVDPAPYYPNRSNPGDGGQSLTADILTSTDVSPAFNEAVAELMSGEFAAERDLQNYLVKNIGRIELGLRVYEQDEISGVEFVAGGRRIDILAVDRNDQFVVIELKVSRAYDKVIGQLLRYMGWVKANMETSLPVRGMIVASDITDDLRLAASHIPNVSLIEYEMEFRLKPVAPL